MIRTAQKAVHAFFGQFSGEEVANFLFVFGGGMLKENITIVSDAHDISFVWRKIKNLAYPLLLSIVKGEYTAQFGDLCFDPLPLPRFGLQLAQIRSVALAVNGDIGIHLLYQAGHEIEMVI